MSSLHNPERRTPLTASQQELAAQYLPLARALARPMKLTWPVAADDFESAACYALVEAAQSYDPARNVKFATFARFRIRGALRDVQRALILRERGVDLALADVPALPAGFQDADRTLRPYEPQVGRELETLETVELLLRKLPPKHAEACRQIYLEGKTQNEAAEWLGCSKSRLSYLHKESIELLNGTWDAKIRSVDAVNS